MLGRSGSGKTTLLRTLARLDPVTHGYVRLPKARAVVFQEPRLLPWKQVWRNVTVGLRDKARKARAIATLHEVGLGHRVDVWPATRRAARRSAPRWHARWYANLPCCCSTSRSHRWML